MSVEAPVQESIDSMKLFMTNLETSLGKSLDPLTKLAKEMSSSKFGKNLKELGKSMKDMAKASIKSAAMAEFMKAFEPFGDLMQLLAPIFSVINALFSVLVNEILKALMPLIIDFTQWLIKLMPVFKKLGEIIGGLIKGAIKFLIDAFNTLKKVVTPFWNFLKKMFVPVLKFIWGLFKVGWGILKGIAQFLKAVFNPIWKVLKGGFEILVDVWKATGGKLFGRNGIISKGLNALLSVGKAIVNAFVSAINAVIGVLNAIPGVEISKIPKLANGALISGPTAAVVGDNKGARTGDPEVVSPLSKLKDLGFGNEEMLEEQKETNMLLGEMVRNQRRIGPWQHL